MQVFKVNDINFKTSLTNKILNDLNEYFDDSMKNKIINGLDKNIYFAVQDSYGFTGFVSLNDTNKLLEIEGLGVFKTFHRQKSGQALIKACIDYARINRKKGIVIKIKDDSSHDQSYLKTRRFLTKMGFINACVIDSNSFLNPCLVMINII